jgi:hypothetical protein
MSNKRFGRPTTTGEISFSLKDTYTNSPLVDPKVAGSKSSTQRRPHAPLHSHASSGRRVADNIKQQRYIATQNNVLQLDINEFANEYIDSLEQISESDEVGNEKALKPKRPSRHRVQSECSSSLQQSGEPSADPVALRKQKSQSITELWNSLNHFSRNNLGRSLDIPRSGNIHFVNIAPTSKTDKTKELSKTMFRNRHESDEMLAFEIPILPCGKLLTLNILSTWGDSNYLGLMGIELFDDLGLHIKLSNPETQIWADPAGSMIKYKFLGVKS